MIIARQNFHIPILDTHYHHHHRHIEENRFDVSNSVFELEECRELLV